MSASFSNSFVKLLVGSSLALSLAACESSGGIRSAGVGSASSRNAAPADETASTDTSGGASGSASGGGAAGSASSGTQGSSGIGTPIDRSPVLVTAGNALLDATGRGNAARGPLNENAPNSAPVTGTVTQLLASTGQALVRSGDGSSYLVDGLRAAPGSAVTIGAGAGTLVGGPGSNPLLGVNVLNPTPTSGSLATLNGGTNGNLLSANVPANGALATTPGAASGATGGLINANANGSQVLGSGPSTIGASVLSPTQTSGSVLTAGAGSGGQAATLNGTTVASPAAGNGLLGGTGNLGTGNLGNLAGSTGGSAGATGNGAAAVGPLTLGQ